MPAIGQLTSDEAHGLVAMIEAVDLPYMKPVRSRMDETGLYTVQDGKIVKEECFYSMEAA